MANIPLSPKPKKYGPAFRTWTQMFESEFKSERVFRNFWSLILTSFCNFWKVRNRTNSEYSVISECSETPVFDPKTTVFASKTGVIDPNIFPNYFHKIFRSSKKLDISKKFLNFDNRTIPKLVKKKFGKFHLLQGLTKKHSKIEFFWIIPDIKFTCTRKNSENLWRKKCSNLFILSWQN